MSNTELDAIQEKIQKLLALSQSSNPNEAALASAKAEELLIKHNLTLRDLKQQTEMVYENILVGKRIPRPDKLLAMVIAEFYFCRVVTATRRPLYGLKGFTYTVQFVGKSHNVMVATSVFFYLLGKREEFIRSERGLSKKSFRAGFAYGVEEKLMEEKRNQEYQSNNCRDLIVQELNEVNAFLDGLGIKGRGSSPIANIDWGSFGEGKRQGKESQINRMVE